MWRLRQSVLLNLNVWRERGVCIRPEDGPPLCEIRAGAPNRPQTLKPHRWFVARVVDRGVS
jgi:hypothetical protein